MIGLDPEFDEAIRQVEAQLKQVEEACKDIANGLNRILRWLPDPIENKIRSDLTILWAVVKKLYEEIYGFLTNRGSSGALRQAGMGWNAIGGSVSTQSGELSADRLTAGDEWEGSAAKAYARAVKAQNEAMEAVKSACVAMQNALNDLAAALLVFWLAVGTLLASYVIEMTLAALLCVGAITAPAGVAAAVGASGVVFAAATAAATALVTYVNNVREKQVELAQQVSSNRAFQAAGSGTGFGSISPWGGPGVDWPSAVSEKMSDASVKDGDGSDWKLKEQ